MRAHPGCEVVVQDGHLVADGEVRDVGARLGDRARRVPAESDGRRQAEHRASRTARHEEVGGVDRRGRHADPQVAWAQWRRGDVGDERCVVALLGGEYTHEKHSFSRDDRRFDEAAVTHYRCATLRREAGTLKWETHPGVRHGGCAPAVRTGRPPAAYTRGADPRRRPTTCTCGMLPKRRNATGDDERRSAGTLATATARPAEPGNQETHR
ncbi:hypothetical protein GCM10009751_12130 [Myceligenerans crystallogenes]|uniref:Uncharacterized protein n=1 Tax=Myceligenerans crystallogenes TaxID=316335 RepID=A0ABN2N7K5_9MICO